MTKEELMRDCGVPTGLMYQPKIAEGLFPPRLCSAPVYLYGSSAIVFGCSSTVTGVDEDWNVGGYKGYVEMGVDALLQELEAHANEEAAIAELASPRVPAADRARADQMLERLSQSPSPRMRDAATRALARRR